MSTLKFRTNHGLVRTTGGGVGFSCKARDENEIFVPTGSDIALLNRQQPNGAPRILNSDGTLDTNFNSGGAGAYPGRTHKPLFLSDGKIILTGNFTKYNGTTVRSICRLNANGSLDTSFNSGGSGLNGYIWYDAIDVDSNGKYIIAGAFTSYNGTSVGNICRLNTDGSLDTSFNSGGAGFNSLVSSVTVLSSGKILVTHGSTTYNSTTVSYVTRLNSDGSLDTSFNSGGTGPNNACWYSQELSDGKILVSGQQTTYNGTGTLGGFMRLNSNGTLDTSFNSGGSGPNDIAKGKFCVQPDGKIVICGWFTQYNGTSTGNIARLNSNGTLDTSFDTQGLNTAGYAPEGVTYQDGKIIVNVFSVNALPSGTTSMVYRLNSDGSLDTSFNSGKNGASSFGVYYTSLLADGRIFLSGSFAAYDNWFSDTGAAIAKWDSSVNGNFQSNAYWVKYLRRLSDGKYLCLNDQYSAAATYGGSVMNGGISRLNSDLTMDTSFNSGNTGLNGGQTKILRLSPDNSGKIYIGGTNFTNYNGTSGKFFRLNSDGSLDTGFNSGGAGFNGDTYNLGFQSNGKLIVGGAFTTYNGTSVNKLCRLNTDGSLDTSFNSGGTGPNVSLESNTVVVLKDDKIILNGAITSYNGTAVPYICRLNSDGSLDTSFNSGGSGFNISHTFSNIEVAPDGKLFIAGRQSMTYNGSSAYGLLRLNSDGTIDNSFSLRSIAAGDCYDCVVGLDGKVYLLGTFESYDGDPKANFFIRVNYDGSIDEEFTLGLAYYVNSINNVNGE